MASAGYLALLEQDAVQWAVLCELTARQALRVWTSAGSGAYSTPFDTYTHPAALRADRGLYREIVGVSENGTALTERASLALVQANPGSWFFDAATDTLYVETSGSVDPDTLSLMQAEFVVRLATRTMTFAGLPPYDGQIDGQSLPTMRFERPELLRGVTAFPSGDLTVLNADGFWDYPAAAWYWENATARFLAGGDDLAYADYEPLPTMEIARPPAAGDDVATFQLRSQSNATDTAFPKHTLSDFYGQTLPENPGAYFPAWYGRVIDAPLVPVCQESPSLYRWVGRDPLIGDSGGRVAEEVVAVERATGTRTILSPTGDYFFVSGSEFGFWIDIGYSPNDYDILATMSRAGQTCGAIAGQILRDCGIPAAAIADATFDQADLDNPAVLGLHVAGGDQTGILVTGTELLNLIERSTIASVYQAADGLWTMEIWDPSFDLASLDVRTDQDLSSWVPVKQVTEPLAPTVLVRYGRRVFGDIWRATSATSTAAQARLVSSASEPVDTCLVDAADAAVLAARLQLVASRPSLQFDAIDGPVAMTLVPGAKVRVTRARGASLSGTFDQPLEVETVQKRLASMTVDVRLGNQRGLGALVKVAAPDGGAAWSTATDEEQLQYAFACDDLGFVDAADASTFEQAVSW